MSSLIATSVSGGVADTRKMSLNEPSDFQSGNVAKVPDPEDIPLAVLLHSARKPEEGEDMKEEC